MPTVACRSCAKEFYAKPSWLLKGFGIYCSRECQSAGRKTGQIILCSLCGKEAYKQQKALNGSKSQKYFCGRECAVKWHNSVFIENNHGNWKHGAFSYRRILQRSSTNETCVLCRSIDDRVLSVHHIDKDRKNNKTSNLIWLCRNCHHLVHNYAEAEARLVPYIKKK